MTTEQREHDSTHPFSVHDMLAMDRIGEPQVSPDARHIAFTLRVTDLEANKGRTDLWLVGIDGTGCGADDASGRVQQPALVTR